MVKPRNLNLAVLRNDPNEIYEGTCLSTDTKPTNWPDNSILFELDTGTRYYSNSGTWYPVGGGADAGSGGGGGGMAIHVDENRMMDKTWQEITDAILGGVVPIVIRLNTPSGVNYGTVTSTVQLDANVYLVSVEYSEGAVTYVADSTEGYPHEDQT